MHSFLGRRHTQSGASWLSASVFFWFVVTNGWAQSGPTGKPELWQLNPYDEIVLINDQAYQIEPQRFDKLAPVANITKEQAEAAEELWSIYIGQEGLPFDKERIAENQSMTGLLNRYALYKIIAQKDQFEYFVKGEHIKEIRHYENILLQKAAELIRQGSYDAAYRHLEAIYRKAPKWPGLYEGRIAIQAAEGDERMLKGDWERAFWLLYEEHRLKENLSQFTTRNGTSLFRQELDRHRNVLQDLQAITDSWIEVVLTNNRYGEARKILARLESVYPQSTLLTRWRNQFQRDAERTLKEFETAFTEKRYAEAAEALDVAISILPDDAKVQATGKKLFSEYPVLKVATLRLPTFQTGPVTWSPADRRVATLLHQPVLRLVDPEHTGQFASEFVTDVAQENINKRAIFEVNTDLVWPADGKPVTVIDLQRLLADSCEERSYTYHAGLASLVSRIEPQLPDRLVMEFVRPQFQPTAWLQIPFMRMSVFSTESKRRATTSPGWRGLGPFGLLTRKSGERVYLEAQASYPTDQQPKIRQIRELNYPSAPEMLRALSRHEVDMIAYLPPNHLLDVLKVEGAKLATLTQPRIHLLQFNFNRLEMRNAQLRRAIAMSLNRVNALKTVGLSISPDCRLSKTPILHSSVFQNKDIPLIGYDLIPAIALFQTARKQAKTMPQLTFAYSGDVTIRRICESLVSDIKRIGIEVRLVEIDEQALTSALDADIRYAIYEPNDPVNDLITLLTRDNPHLFNNSSSFLRFKLLELIQVPNPTVAMKLIPDLLQVLHDEQVMIPLWEVPDYVVYGENLTNHPKNPVSAYDGIQGWQLEPRFPPAD